jgi:hypothetical protein
MLVVVVVVICLVACSLQCDVADEMSFSSDIGLYHANSTTGTTEGIKSQQDCRCEVQTTKQQATEPLNSLII